MKKGDSVGDLITQAKTLFPQIKSTPAESLLYVNDDMMIPHVVFLFDVLFECLECDSFRTHEEE